jgi:hypothetical protein
VVEAIEEDNILDARNGTILRPIKIGSNMGSINLSQGEFNSQSEINIEKQDPII